MVQDGSACGKRRRNFWLRRVHDHIRIGRDWLSGGNRWNGLKSVPLLELVGNNVSLTQVFDGAQGGLDSVEDTVLQGRMVSNEFFNTCSNENRIFLLLEDSLMALRCEDGKQTRDNASTSSQLILAGLVQTKSTDSVRNTLYDLTRAVITTNYLGPAIKGHTSITGSNPNSTIL